MLVSWLVDNVSMHSSATGLSAIALQAGMASVERPMHTTRSMLAVSGAVWQVARE
jgi:hypothetical protein